MEPHRYRITFALAPDRSNLLLDDLGVLAHGFTECARLYLAKHPEAAESIPSLEVVADPYGPRPTGEEEWIDLASALEPPTRGPNAGRRVIDPAGYVCAVAALTGAAPEVKAKGDRYVVVVPGHYDAVPFRRMRPSRHRVTLVTGLFNGDVDRDLSHATLDVLLETLTRIDELYLAAFPKTPAVNEAGILYMEEPPGQEDWQDIPTCRRMGLADCEDLACWLAAAERARGIPAQPTFTQHVIRHPDGRAQHLYHIVTKLPNGRILDPSRWQGMG